jgi:histidyl-tRNA synthetase
MADTPEQSGSPKRRQHAFQAPKGTRDFYPDDLLKRRWIEETWRQVALRHGFDEIDGPRFEHTDLYTVKSGDGILSELFSFTRAGGKTAFALRPEFTPTLARMVAARANSLPKPIKWFSVGPYFRAERPQRGRLREFLQWNVDVLGSADDDEETKAQQDAEVIACCVEMLRSGGLTSEHIVVRIGQREIVEECLKGSHSNTDDLEPAFALLDKREKMKPAEFEKAAKDLGLDWNEFDRLAEAVNLAVAGEKRADEKISHWAAPLITLRKELKLLGVAEWIKIDCAGIVRGLAYYTGMVFEVHEVGGKERAIAGGGRYDKLVELFGGPPTPACGFAMGDVVLSLVLQDKGLMPSGAELAQTLGARPDAFVISTGTEESEAALFPLVAQLRRSGLHARHTSRTTRNVGKLLKEAAACHARFAVLIDDSAQSATLKNLDTQEQQEGVALDLLASKI